MNNTYNNKTGEEFLGEIAEYLSRMPNIMYMASVVDKLNQYATYAKPSTSYEYGSGGLLPPSPPFGYTNNKPAFFGSDGNWYSTISGSIAYNEAYYSSDHETYQVLLSNATSNQINELSAAYDDYGGLQVELHGQMSLSRLEIFNPRSDLLNWEYSYWMPYRKYVIDGIDSQYNEFNIGEKSGISLFTLPTSNDKPHAAIMLGNLSDSNTATYKPFIMSIKGNDFSLGHAVGTNEQCIQSIWDTTQGSANAVDKWVIKSPSIMHMYTGGLQLWQGKIPDIMDSSRAKNTDYKYDSSILNNIKSVIGANAIKLLRKRSNRTEELSIQSTDDTGSGFSVASTNAYMCFGIFDYNNSRYDLKNMFRLYSGGARISSPFDVLSNKLSIRPVSVTGYDPNYNNYTVTGDWICNTINRDTYGELAFYGPCTPFFADANVLTNTLKIGGGTPSTYMSIICNNAALYDYTNPSATFPTNVTGGGTTEYKYCQQMCIKTKIKGLDEPIIYFNRYYNAANPSGDAYKIIRLLYPIDMRNNEISNIKSLALNSQNTAKITGVKEITMTSSSSIATTKITTSNVTLNANGGLYGALAGSNPNQIIYNRVNGNAFYKNRYAEEHDITTTYETDGIKKNYIDTGLISPEVIYATRRLPINPDDPQSGARYISVNANLQFTAGSIRTNGSGGQSATTVYTHEIGQDDVTHCWYYYRPIIVAPTGTVSPNNDAMQAVEYYKYAPEGTIAMFYS